MLLPGVFIDAIANLSAEHGHGELKEITVADLGRWCPEEVTADLFLPNQEGHLGPNKLTVNTSPSLACSLRMTTSGPSLYTPGRSPRRAMLLTMGGGGGLVHLSLTAVLRGQLLQYLLLLSKREKYDL
jgi:hypothetical protein